MGVLDKIKNALFEVEYVEVEEPVKKDKKVKNKEKASDNSVEKPIAKKIVLPKKEEKVEELQEEELRDDNFEARPKNETIKEENKDKFKFMDEDDFRVDGYVPEEPEIVKVIDKETEILDEKPQRSRHNNYSNDSREDDYSTKVDKYYNNLNKKSYVSNNESKPYGLDNDYKVAVHEYGTYDKKDEKTYFKPSPIISPIYGILDKNYKKEDVVQKKEIRLTTNYTRSNISVDDIRDKAYGNKHDSFDESAKFEVDEEEENTLVDLNDTSKPSVKEVTMGDALEYFQDLGLEYNVDYVDATKNRATPRRAKDNYDDLVSDIKEEIEEVSFPKEVLEKDDKPITVIKDESKNSETKVTIDDDDDDNLFDLIDSMYQES